MEMRSPGLILREHKWHFDGRRDSIECEMWGQSAAQCPPSFAAIETVVVVVRGGVCAAVRVAVPVDGGGCGRRSLKLGRRRLHRVLGWPALRCGGVDFDGNLLLLGVGRAKGGRACMPAARWL